MHPDPPRESDELEPTDETVMTGDGAAPRDEPRPTMTADGARAENDGADDMVMTGDGAEPRNAPRPQMTADGVKATRPDDDGDA
jgi:hypothetical protein